MIRNVPGFERAAASVVIGSQSLSAFYEHQRDAREPVLALHLRGLGVYYHRGWQVLHVPTGLLVARNPFRRKRDAVAFAREIAGLTDWLDVTPDRIPRELPLEIAKARRRFPA